MFNRDICLKVQTEREREVKLPYSFESGGQIAENLIYGVGREVAAEQTPAFAHQLELVA